MQFFENYVELAKSFSINPLQPSFAFLYPLKTFRFSDVFRGYRKATPGCSGLSTLSLHNSLNEKLMVFTKYLGAAYGRAESNIKKFVEATGLPFLPTPMGKGVLSDNHPQCVAAARSRFIHVFFRHNVF